jgi:hypothetical protein
MKTMLLLKFIAFSNILPSRYEPSASTQGKEFVNQMSDC